MSRNTQILFGAIVIIVGLLFLLSSFLDISIFAICIPSVLILIGIWILIRPRLVPEDSEFRLRIFGNLRKRGDWMVTGQEAWMFIGDVRLDFSEAEVPQRETYYRFVAFIGDIRIKVPENVGVSISSMAFVNEIHFPGIKRDAFLVPVEFRTDGYEAAETKIRLETICFIGDIRLEQTPAKNAATPERIDRSSEQL